MPFQKGNKAAVGSPGPQRPKFLTQALISQLNEIVKRGRVITETTVDKRGKIVKTHRYDTKTNSNIHFIVEALITNAVDDRDMAAIKEIFDRIEGKVVQAVEGTGETDKAITIRLIPGDEKL